MNRKTVFNIGNTKPLDAIILEKLIKELCNWKDKADYRLDSLKTDNPDKDADYINQIKVLMVYDELDDIASLDTIRPTKEVGYLNSIERSVHHQLFHIDHNNLSTFNPSIINIYKFLINLFPTTKGLDNISGKTEKIIDPITKQKIIVTGSDKGIIDNVIKEIRSIEDNE